jgi:hypothetical protein
MTDAGSHSNHEATRSAKARDLRSREVPVPRLLLVGLPLNILALAGGSWMFVNAFILIDETAPLAVILLSLTNIIVLALVAQRIVRMRAVESHRQYSRVEIEIDGMIGRLPCLITELSLGGCKAQLDTPAALNAGEQIEVAFEMAGIQFQLTSIVQSSGIAPNGKQLLRISFKPGQDGYIERLALGMLAEGEAAAAA